MLHKIQFSVIILLIFTLSKSVNAQTDQISILNDVIISLKGEIDATDIKVFKNIDEVCNSKYISCDRKKRIIGLDFQFANLNGNLPQMINQLTDLEYINLEYNYIDGTIPEGLIELPDLEELSLNGNFIEAPLPNDIVKLSKKVFIDLSRNTIKVEDRRLVKKLNIINQINLQGCRSPDSIFLDIDLDTENEVLDAVTPKDDDDTMKVVETMPRFPGCEDKNMSDAERKDCAEQSMLQFIYKNLRYPYEARMNNIEGMVVAQFVVLKNGDIGNAKVVRGPGGRCGNASLWVVNRMNYICDKWIPGSQEGKDVKVQYTLPVKFKLEG